MVRPFPVLLAALATASLASAQTPREAWTRFAADRGPEFTAEWHAATDTPRVILGSGVRISDLPVATLERARPLADAFLNEHRNLLGMGTSDFAPRIAETVRNLHILVYDQRFRGLEVIGGRLDVRMNQGGIVSMFGSRAVPVPADFDVRAQVPAAAASRTAHEAFGLVAPNNAETRLVVWSDPDAATRSDIRLAWEVRIDRADVKYFGRSFVDARTGDVIRYVNELHECEFGCSHHAHVEDTGSSEVHVEVIPGPTVPDLMNITGTVQAWTNTGLSPTDPLVNIPLRGLQVNASGIGSAFTDENGFFSIPHSGTAPVNVTFDFEGRRSGQVNASLGSTFSGSASVTPGTPATVQIFTSGASEFDRSQSTIYWATDFVNEYVRTILPGLPSLIDNITSTANSNQSCNATYGGNNMTFYAAGGGCNNTGYSTVVYHEWGHGLDDRYGGISQNDGLSEGWGDTVATYASGQPIIGDDFRTNGGIVRTALNTLTYPAGGSVHTEGSVWMGFNWDVRTALIGKLGSAAGIATAEQIVLGSIVADATNQPNAVLEVFLLDDDDGDLTNGTPNYDVLSEAAEGRTLPYPVRQATIPGTYTTFGSGCIGTGTQALQCQSINAGGNPAGLTTRDDVAYALRVTASSNLTIRGFDLQTSRSGGTTIPVKVYDEQGGQPGNELASGTITVGSTRAWYGAILSQTVSISSGQSFYIAFENDSNAIEASTVTSGTSVQYFRDDGPGGSWNGPINGIEWQYRIVCDGPLAAPVLSATGLPETTRSFSIDLNDAAPTITGALIFGVSNTTSALGALPFDFGSLGAPGCSLLVSPDLAVPVATANGQASVSISVPDDQSLVGAEFYNQYLLLDTAANAAGLVVSNGAFAKIGQF